MLSAEQSEKDIEKIILCGRKGILNQPCNQPIDLGLSVCWSNSNVGACETIDAGGFYSSKDSLYQSYSTSSSEEKHIPTENEWNELINECTWKWIEEYNCVGYLIKGPNGKYIFLPAAGKQTDKGLEEEGFEGYYWANAISASNSSLRRNMTFSYDPSLRFISLVYMPDVMKMPIRLVFKRLC